MSREVKARVIAADFNPETGQEVIMCVMTAGDAPRMSSDVIIVIPEGTS